MRLIDIIMGQRSERKPNPQSGFGFVPKPSKPTQQKKVFQVLGGNDLKAATDRSNPQCAFHDRIGQDTVVDQLLTVLAQALQNENHVLKGSNAFLFTGPPSTGKTDFAKLLSGKDGLDLPFVETDARQIRNSQDIFELSKSSLKEAGISLTQLTTKNGQPFFRFPPMVIFIDEIHGLSSIVMDSLLKALEPKDALLVTGSCYVDCKQVLWIGATTERGSILARKPAFDSRFDKIEFSSYTKEEVAQIIHLNFPHWSEQECQSLAVRSGSIVREALSIGKKVDRQLDYMRIHGDANRLTAIDKVSEQLQIDHNGMSDKQWAVLHYLSRRHPKGATYGQLAKVINRTVEELKEVVLPALMIVSNDTKPLVTWSGQTYVTEEGLLFIKSNSRSS